MLFRWLIGFTIGTAFVASTSPWFVRSYVPRVEDRNREAAVLQPHSSYRWRSEGYATTRIGLLGMPGQTSVYPDKIRRLRIALWGDSQAEGICVKDDQKLATLTTAILESPCVVMPFARSGDDCNDWIRQIAAIEKSSETWLSIDAHVFLVVEWSDWCVDVHSDDDSIDQSFNQLSRTLPAFLIQVARNALTTGQTNRIRNLRFRPGPVSKTDKHHRVDTSVGLSEKVEKLEKQLKRLRRQTDVPCIFLYAPLTPAIAGGKVNHDDPDEPLFADFISRCKTHNFHVVDLRSAMTDAASAGRWPRGFHNGQFGVGHYNAIGNQIIADHLAEKVQRIGLQD